MNKGKNINNYQFTGDFMYSKITDAANNAWQELAAEKTMDQAGYVYIYTATESKITSSGIRDSNIKPGSLRMELVF